MKCLKCNGVVSKSKHSGFNGFESYRCKDCNELFDKRDFKLLKEVLKEPNFQCKRFKELFDELIVSKKCYMEIGEGKSIMIKAILKENPNTLLIVDNNHIKVIYKELDSVETVHSIIRGKVNVNNYDFIIFDELRKNYIYRVLEKMKDSSKLYFFNYR